jgi:hypothetical protein
MATGTAAGWNFWPVFISFIDTTKKRRVLLQSDTDSRLLLSGRTPPPSIAAATPRHPAVDEVTREFCRVFDGQSIDVSTVPVTGFIHSKQKLSLFESSGTYSQRIVPWIRPPPQKMAPHPVGPSLSSMTVFSENHEHQSGPPRVTDLFQLSKKLKQKPADSSTWSTPLKRSIHSLEGHHFRYYFIDFKEFQVNAEFSALETFFNFNLVTEFSFQNIRRNMQMRTIRRIMASFGRVHWLVRWMKRQMNAKSLLVRAPIHQRFWRITQVTRPDSADWRVDGAIAHWFAIHLPRTCFVKTRQASSFRHPHVA